MVYIDAVHYEKDSHGYDVIANVRWTNNLDETATKSCTKAAMIKFINENPNCTKTKYLKNGSYILGEDVRVIDNSYIRSDANNIKKDNLGSLPAY